MQGSHLGRGYPRPFAPSAAFAQSKRVPVGIELYSVRGELVKDLPGTVRASFGVHNDAADIDRLADALVAARQILAR